MLDSINSSLLGKRLWALVRLVRPLNVLMFAAGVLVGGVMAAGADAGTEPHRWLLLGAVCSAMLVGAGGNVLNDMYDLEHDRINRPTRPLPAGLVTLPTARWLGVFLLLAGVGVGLVVSWGHGVVSLTAAGLLWGYSARLKHQPLIGNITIALMVGLTLWYGSAAVGDLAAAHVGVGFAFFTTLVRELVKDVEDQEGDAKAGSRTLPLVWGTPRVMHLAAAVLGITLLLTPWPFLVLDYSGVFLLFMLAAGGGMLRALALLMSTEAEAHAPVVSRVMKGVMLLGLVGLALA